MTNGSSAVMHALADEEGVDGAYFKGELLKEASRDGGQATYRQQYRHVDPRRPESFLVDANPKKAETPGWLGHRINDGACVAPGMAEEDALIEYYEASGKRRNCVPLALCVPLVGYVTTSDVREGEELLTTYGHQYWTGSDTYEAADRAEELTAACANAMREADMWQVATDKKHGKRLNALSGLIAQASEEMLG